MKRTSQSFRLNKRVAEYSWGPLTMSLCSSLRSLTMDFDFSVSRGDITCLSGNWYITHSGLLHVASRRRCVGIQVEMVKEFCDATSARWAFKAIVFPSDNSAGFVGYGDADPSNVSPLVRGCELRIAETRAVNRALRKAYGIGLCSVEELGANFRNEQDSTVPIKIPAQPAAGSGPNGRKVRDQLCQIIRQHELDPNLVKAYAVDYCGVKTLKDATREQVQNFVKELSDWAEKDRNALLCQLNSYLGNKEGAA